MGDRCKSQGIQMMQLHYNITGGQHENSHAFEKQENTSTEFTIQILLCCLPYRRKKTQMTQISAKNLLWIPAIPVFVKCSC